MPNTQTVEQKKINRNFLCRNRRKTKAAKQTTWNFNWSSRQIMKFSKIDGIGNVLVQRCYHERENITTDRPTNRPFQSSLTMNWWTDAHKQSAIKQTNGKVISFFDYLKFVIVEWFRLFLSRSPILVCVCVQWLQCSRWYRLLYIQFWNGNGNENINIFEEIQQTTIIQVKKGETNEIYYIIFWSSRLVGCASSLVAIGWTGNRIAIKISNNDQS